MVYNPKSVPSDTSRLSDAQREWVDTFYRWAQEGTVGAPPMPAYLTDGMVGRRLLWEREMTPRAAKRGQLVMKPMPPTRGMTTAQANWLAFASLMNAFDGKFAYWISVAHDVREIPELTEETDPSHKWGDDGVFTLLAPGEPGAPPSPLITPATKTPPVTHVSTEPVQTNMTEVIRRALTDE